MAKTTGRNRRRRARPLLVALGAIVLGGGGCELNGTRPRNCDAGNDCSQPPVNEPDLSATAPADLGAIDLGPRTD